ncbi:MAG: 2-C-methyl-D-erythritol 4-phosphate cytidylyltransferase [Mycoplasmatales bacterium]
MYSVVILAAGSGSRMNLGYNKMIHKINDKIIINITLEKFINNDLINEIIVTVNFENFEYIKENIVKNDKIRIIQGGCERQDSVYEAIKYLKSNSTNEYVLVHDGARCNISNELIAKCIGEIKNVKLDGYGVGVKEKNSIREVENGYVSKILNRDKLYSMQTPQISKISILYDCLKKASKSNTICTDEVSLLVNNGYEVKIIEGEYSNIKITTPDDLRGIND